MRDIVKTVKHEFGEEGAKEEMIFQIHKMNALDGAWLIKFVAEKIIPLIDGFKSVFSVTGEIKTEEEMKKATEARAEAITKILPVALASISKEELYSFEKQCLNSVEMMKPAGWQRVMSGDTFGVEEVEYDPILGLVLCYDVIEFNFAGFFGGSGLSSVLPR